MKLACVGTVHVFCMPCEFVGTCVSISLSTLKHMWYHAWGITRVLSCSWTVPYVCMCACMWYFIQIQTIPCFCWWPIYILLLLFLIFWLLISYDTDLMQVRTREFESSARTRTWEWNFRNGRAFCKHTHEWSFWALTLASGAFEHLHWQVKLQWDCE